MIGGNGQLAKTGSGVLILTAAETYSGPTTISAGTLQLDNGGFLNAASTITDNGTLAFNNSGTLTQGTNFSSAAITGSGGLTGFRRPGDLEQRGKHLHRQHRRQRGHAGGKLSATATTNPPPTALGDLQRAGRTITINPGGRARLRRQVTSLGGGAIGLPHAEHHDQSEARLPPRSATRPIYDRPACSRSTAARSRGRAATTPPIHSWNFSIGNCRHHGHRERHRRRRPR